jgi:hypothetical protein
MRRLILCAQHGIALSVTALAALCAWTGPVLAQATGDPIVRLAAADDDGPGWSQLSPAQRGALAPLQRDWDKLELAQKQKWLELAARYPRIADDERRRLQARMTEWARMTPQERVRARQHFQEVRKVSPEDRQEKWRAYQALPEDQRRRLAGGAARRSDSVRSIGLVGIRSGAQSPKLNIVANPAYAEPPKAVAPTVVQARPGATTKLLSQRPTPPTHQQPGLQKIAAEPEFIDPETLLPRRGPQGAATRPARVQDPRATAKP